MSELVKYEAEELSYAATARCKCGAGLAYPHGEDALKLGHWFCSRVLLGEVEIETDKSRRGDVRQLDLSVTMLDASGTEHDAYPFAFYEIKDEGQPSAGNLTTRPPEQGVMKQRDHLQCANCGHAWQSAVYSYFDEHKWPAHVCEICGARSMDEHRGVLLKDVRKWKHEHVLVKP